MSHPQLAHAPSCVLVVIDWQEPFAKAMSERATVAKNITTLLHVAKIIGLPVIVTEQNAEKLGPTSPDLRGTLEELGYYKPINKMAFSCCSVDSFVKSVYDTGRDTLLITGLEGHVCVQQTVLEALNLGYKAHLIRDAVASRRAYDLDLAVEKMRHAGAVISSTEMLSYELLGQAGTPEFKAAAQFLKW